MVPSTSSTASRALPRSQREMSERSTGGCAYHRPPCPKPARSGGPTRSGGSEVALALGEQAFDTHGMRGAEARVRTEEQLERLAAAADRARPTALARERVLPVAEPLLPLVAGGLVR